MAEYSRLASGQVLSAGASFAVNIPFIPTRVEITNETSLDNGSGVSFAKWAKNMGQGAAALTTITSYATTPAVLADVSSFTTVGGITTFEAGIALQYGPTQNVASITNTSNPTVTTSAPHGLVSGAVIIFQNLYQTSSTGMPQICGIPFEVTVTGATTFTILWNASGSNYTAIGVSPYAQGTFKQLLFPNLYAPNVGFVSAVTAVGSGSAQLAQITVTAPTNIQVGQLVAFRIPAGWGMEGLNSLPNPTIPGSPTYATVVSVLDEHTFVVNVNVSSFSAFNPNQPFYPGLNIPQVVGIGDLNTGSNQLNFLPPSFYSGSGTSAVASIGSPGIAGAFCNNTSQGFIIGDAIAGTRGDIIDWVAILDDLVY